MWASGSQDVHATASLGEVTQLFSKWPVSQSSRRDSSMQFPSSSLFLQGARDVAMRIKWLLRHAAARRQRALAEAAEADRKQGRARGQSIFATPAPRSSSGPVSGPVIAEVPFSLERSGT